MRVIALIDGEHHPSVVRGALDRLAAQHDLRAVLFVGGEEKVAPAVLADAAAHYGRDLVTADANPVDALRDLAAHVSADAVADLSGDPVLDAEARLHLASIALHAGLEYRSPGLELAPPATERLPFDGPLIAVIGTGKRTGKTALAGHYASLVREQGREPVIVCMGRGGPEQPQLVRAGEAPDLEALLEIARAGVHAASDHLENAALEGVSTVGCRRCGEGLAGEPFDSNVVEGARLALSLDPDVLLLEGSGAAIPPIESHVTVCVTAAGSARREALCGLGPYRLLRSDLVLVAGAERLPGSELSDLKNELGRWSRGRVVGFSLVPSPAEPVPSSARVAFFTTAPRELEPELRDQLAQRGIELAAFSSSLARRAELERDLERARRERCDTYLTELKATAVELVAAEAKRRGARVTFVRNEPVSLAGEPELDDELACLLDEALERAGHPAAGPARGRATVGAGWPRSAAVGKPAR